MNKIHLKFDFLNIVLLLYLIAIFTMSDYKTYVELFFIGCFSIDFLKKKSTITTHSLWVFLLLGLSFLSLFWTSNYSQTLIETRLIFQWFLTSVIFVSYIDSNEKLKSLYNSIIIAGFALILKLLYVFPISTWLSGRIGSNLVGLNSNLIGIYLSICLTIAFFFWVKNVKDIKYLLFSLIYVAVIFLTGSRKAILMAMLTILFIFIFTAESNVKKLRNILWSSVLILLLVYLLLEIPVFYEIAGSRIERLFNSLSGTASQDYSTMVRSGMYRRGFELFYQKPYFGYGLGSFSVLSGYDTYSHNNYTELLVGVGALGFVIYYYKYVVYMMKLVFKKWNRVFVPIFVSFLLIAIIETGYVSYNDPVTHLILDITFVGLYRKFNPSQQGGF